MRFPIRGELTPRRDLAIGLVGIGILLLAWCVLTYGGLVGPFFLPKPPSLFEALANFHQKGWLLPAIWRSFARVTKSLLLVTAVGVPIGVLMGAFAPVDAFLRKLISGAKSVPTTGLIGLVILYFSIGEGAKIFFLFVGAIFYMIILVKNAVATVSEDYVRVAIDLGARPRQIIGRVLLPGALPQIWEAVAVCNGIMWTYIVLAEFINSNEEQLGLGYLLQIGSRTQEPAKVFAVLAIVALISSFTDFLLHAFRRRFLDW